MNSTKHSFALSEGDRALMAKESLQQSARSGCRVQLLQPPKELPGIDGVHTTADENQTGRFRPGRREKSGQSANQGKSHKQAHAKYAHRELPGREIWRNSQKLILRLFLRMRSGKLYCTGFPIPSGKVLLLHQFIEQVAGQRNAGRTVGTDPDGAKSSFTGYEAARITGLNSCPVHPVGCAHLQEAATSGYS